MNRTAVQRWALAQAMLWLPFLIVAGWVNAVAAAPGRVIAPAAALLMLGSYAVLWLVLQVGRHVADWVTLARALGLIGLCSAAGYSGDVSWPIWFGLVAVVCADLLDGFCARRWGGSRAGAVLDMETDQMATLGLALLAMICGDVGPWVLLLPGIKYVFVLVFAARGATPHDPKPINGDNRRARFLCAAVMVLLLALTFPLVTPLARTIAAGTAVMLLVYSFGSDAAFMLRRAH